MVKPSGSQNIQLVFLGLVSALVGTAVLAAILAAAPNALKGDINGDNKVDVSDLSLLLTNFGKPVSQTTNANTDINLDGTVSITDLSVLLTNFGKTGPSDVPTANFSFTPTAPVTGQPVTYTFTGTCSVTPCTYSYANRQADGSFLEFASTASASFTYQNVGGKTIRLTVTDAQARTATTQKDITVGGGGTPTPSPTTTPTSTPTPTPSPELLWRADWSGVAAGTRAPSIDAPTLAALSGFSKAEWDVYTRTSVTIINDAVKGKALSAVIPANYAGTHRAEQVPTYRPGAGSTIWLGFDIWVNPDLNVSTTWESGWQLKGSGTGSPAASMDVASFGVNELAISASNIRHFKLGSVPRGQWTRIVIGMYMHATPGQGWLEVWRDGQSFGRKNWSSTCVAPDCSWSTGSTVIPGKAMYYKFGPYGGARGAQVNFRYANMKIGSSRTSVMQ